ncbi:MAG TPA: acyl carrier protein [Micromonosporaceae bacterium]
MRTDLEDIVRDRVSQVVDDVSASELELGRDMADDYGLTSLNKVLLLTMVCEDAGVDLARFTEPDVAAMRTAGDVVAALAARTQPVGQA